MRRAPPVYTQAARPPPGPARAIWELLSGRFSEFEMQWSPDLSAFAVSAEETEFRLSQHAAIAADEMAQLFDGRLWGGKEPRAMRALVAVLDSWRSTTEISAALTIPKRLVYDRLSRALRLGLIEGRPVPGDEQKERPAREWRRKDVAA